MIIGKHGSFYLRRGWGTKIVQAVEKDELIFSPSNELQAVDEIGLGRVMIKALRYWSDVSGLIIERKTQGGVYKERTPLFNLIAENDRYFQKQGSLLLLHRNIVTNKDGATAWYWAYNEMDKQVFSKAEFVDGLQYYLAVNGMSIKNTAVEKEFNCFRNTYIGERKLDIKSAIDEDTYPLLAPLRLLKVNGERKIEKNYLTKADIPLSILIYAIADDNPAESNCCGQVSIDKLMEEQCQIGKYYPIRYSKLIDMLMEAENTELIGSGIGMSDIFTCLQDTPSAYYYPVARNLSFHFDQFFEVPLFLLIKKHQDACLYHAYPDAFLPATGPIGKDLNIQFLYVYSFFEFSTPDQSILRTSIQLSTTT